MSKKITLGRPTGRAKNVVIELGDPEKPTRFKPVAYSRDIEDALEQSGRDIDEIAADPDKGGRDAVIAVASQLDYLLERAPDQPEGADERKPSEIIIEEYDRDGSELTRVEVNKLAEDVGKEVRPT